MVWAKYLLLAVLALPLAELVVFILVAIKIGFWWAFALGLTTSFCGWLVLRSGGGGHVERASVVFGPGRINALQADSSGFLVLLAGLLLLLPGFISDVIGLVLLIGPLRRWIGGRAQQFAKRQTEQATGVIDLPAEDWRQVPDAQITDRNGPNRPDR